MSLAELPVLTTERLRLRLPRPSDAAALARYTTENREFLAPTSPPRKLEYYTREYWKRVADGIVREYLDDRGLRLLLCANERPKEICGMIHFGQIIRGPFHACYVGYEIAEKAQGRGLMTEALGAAIEFAFADRNLHRIMANYLPENTRSARVLEKLGFHREGIAPKYLFIAGAWRDHVLTAKTNANWRAPEDFQT